MKKMVIANWKANLSPEKAMQWCDTFAQSYRPRLDLEVILAVPFLCLERVAGEDKASCRGMSGHPGGFLLSAGQLYWIDSSGMAARTGEIHLNRSQGAAAVFS